MVKRISLGVLLFLICYLVFLVATLPAAIVWEHVLKDQVPAKSGVRVQAVDGSVWNGRAQMNIEGINSIVDWDVDFPSLTSLTLPLHLEVKSDAGELSGALDVGKNTQVATIFKADIDASRLNRMLRKQRIKLSGDVLANGLKVVVEDNKIVDLAGRFSWSGGPISYPAGRRVKNQEFPAFVGSFNREGEIVKLGIRDQDANFDVIDGELGADGVALLRVKRRVLDLANEKWPSNSTEQDVIFKVKRPLTLDFVQK